MSDDLKRLQDYIHKIGAGNQVAVAFSAGVDSTLLAVVALEVLGELQVMTVDSEFIARSELARVESLSQSLNLPLSVLSISLLDEAGIRMNGPDRCYRCKRKIMATIRKVVGHEALILDGTNAGDDPDRPGLRALNEAGVVSPLAECGLDKKSIRKLAGELKLPNAQLPSNSCLATRIINQGLHQAALDSVEQVEKFLAELGFSGSRARVDDLKVIVETPRGSEELLEQNHERIKVQIEKMGLTLAGYGTRPAGRESE